MEIPDGLRYTDDHEWLRLESEDGVVGVTAYAAGELGDVVFVELPAVGTKLTKAQSFGVIESVKTASDLFSPAAGEIVAVNEALADRPELVNDDPYGEGWMVRIRLDDPSSIDALRDAESYRELVEAA